jgi:ribonuclease BN (tRNA processing enzyme)
MTHEFDFVTYPEEPFEVGPFTVTVAPVIHPVEAYAMRLEHNGKVLVYSGDTSPTPELDRLTHGADVFLCEAAFEEGKPNPEGLHLTGKEAGDVATGAGVGSLIVTHVPPWGDSRVALREAVESFTGPTELARPGLSVEF